MAKKIRFSMAAICVVAGAGISWAAARQQEAQPIPQQLQAPGIQPLVRVHAKGDQIYSCKEDGGKFGWTLKAPEAQLFDKDDKLFGKHFAGPSWEASDGSRVTGKAVATAPSPDSESIAWLLVTVVKHEGNGVLTPVTTIQRINTKGGKAPATGCDAKHSGVEVRAAYTADYIFYVPN